jgi:hypothetical protein
MNKNRGRGSFTPPTSSPLPDSQRSHALGAKPAESRPKRTRLVGIEVRSSELQARRDDID